MLALKHGRQRRQLVEWLKCHDHHRHNLCSKSTRTILWCPWERQFAALSLAWWYWQAVLNYRYWPVKVGFLYTEVRNSESCLSINTSRKGRE